MPKTSNHPSIIDLEHSDSPIETLPHTIADESSKNNLFTDQLGLATAVYRQAEIKRGIRKFLFTGLFLALLFLVFSGIRYSYGYMIHGYAVAITWSRWSFVIGVILLTIFLGVYLYMKTNLKTVSLHQDGIALYRQGRKPILFLWRQLSGISYSTEEISFLFAKFHSSTASLHPHHGKSVNLLSYCKIESLPDLVTRIKARLYSMLEPDLVKSFHNGQTLYFGDLAISSSGIKIINKSYEWNNIEQISIQDGYLQFIVNTHNRENSKIENRIRLSLHRVHNPELFLIVARNAGQLAALHS